MLPQPPPLLLLLLLLLCFLLYGTCSVALPCDASAPCSSLDYTLPHAAGRRIMRRGSAARPGSSLTRSQGSCGELLLLMLLGLLLSLSLLPPPGGWCVMCYGPWRCFNGWAAEAHYCHSPLCGMARRPQTVASHAVLCASRVLVHVGAKTLPCCSFYTPFFQDGVPAVVPQRAGHPRPKRHQGDEAWILQIRQPAAQFCTAVRCACSTCRPAYPSIIAALQLQSSMALRQGLRQQHLFPCHKQPSPTLLCPLSPWPQVCRIEPLQPNSASGGFKVTVQRAGAAEPERLYARKVVLATGIQGGGEW